MAKPVAPDEPEAPGEPGEPALQADLAAKEAEPAGKRPLTPEAQRALAEAEARRQAQDQANPKSANEIGGRNGPDPVRFGDWEKNGIVSDF